MTTLASEDDARWDAVTRRDASRDGRFVYAVATTGIYCRPSCPARRPRRGNVTFFASPAEAEKAGFRACKRCSPGRASEAAPLDARIAAACRTIEAAGEPPRLASLAREAGLSQGHFHRAFVRVTGITPAEYARGCRQRRLREVLPSSRSVTEAMYDAGYNSSSRLHSDASPALGMSPSQFRAGGKGIEMRFAVGECSLGAVLVAATEKGVCAILLGDDAQALVRDLQDRFPAAEIVGGDRKFEALTAQVIELVENPGCGAGLPLDVRGTAFQLRVWRALVEIPAGATLSYAELARRIGRPTAARAVARACGANPAAVAIPCHRVVGSDGELSGYRWGIERKRELLKRERRD
jgi:AraC family transcriptional regulator of adaptative response/methylated-DNA-[protein]-cysteine methyltransferase